MRNLFRVIKTNSRGAEFQGGVTKVLPAWMPEKKEVKNMRKTTLIIGIVAGITIAFLAGLGTGTQSASADAGPHVATGSDATPDKCASCHRIHTGQNEYLLKEAGSVQAFCYSCHGTGGTGSDLAVQEGTSYGGAGLGLRAGGFEQARINTTDPSNSLQPNPVAPTVSIGVLAATEPVNSTHSIDGTTAGTMWGNGVIVPGVINPGLANQTLECTDCHDPHGNNRYRILRDKPTGSLATADVAIPDTYPKTPVGYTTTNYLNMYFGGNPVNPMTDTAIPGVSILYDTSRWCAQCHTRYLAESGTDNPLSTNPKPNAQGSRVDSGDDVFTFRHTSMGYGFSSYGSPTIPAGFKYNNRACITCHASHGSNSQMTGPISSTVEYPGGATPAALGEREAMLKMDNRGICRKCHSAQ